MSRAPQRIPARAAYPGRALRRAAVAIAPAGRYAYNGVAYDCPAGRFGRFAGETRSTCSGPCAVGYFCTAGSTRAMARECGGPDRLCPAGAVAPVRVTPGYYTSDASDAPHQ